MIYMVICIQRIKRRNDKYDEKSPEEVLGERVKRVGGMDETGF